MIGIAFFSNSSFNHVTKKKKKTCFAFYFSREQPSLTKDNTINRKQNSDDLYRDIHMDYNTSIPLFANGQCCIPTVPQWIGIEI